jgi:hypothetical protein
MKTSTRIPWGDSIDTIKYSRSLEEWYQDYPMLDYSFFKLPSYYSFDIDEMRYQINQIIQTHETKSIKRNSQGKRYERYRGLGFYSRENVDTPLEDHFTRRDLILGEQYTSDLYMKTSLPNLYEDDFSFPTEILNDYFSSIFLKFKSKITKASLLELCPKGYLSSHVDFPYYKGIRLHAVIYGGDNSWYEVNGEKFQIPSDGNWYFIDTGKFHSAYNFGPESRLSLNINLSNINSSPKSLAENFNL